MEVHALNTGGIKVINLDKGQIKTIIYMQMKFNPRCFQERKFKVNLNEGLLIAYLSMIKNEIKHYTLQFATDIDALMFYQVVSSYTDEETEFTKTLTARVFNAIPSPIDDLLTKI